VQDAKAFLAGFGSTSLELETQEFLRLDETNFSSQPTENKFHFEHPTETRSIEIQVGTIHSVKGQTHDATLLLETFLRAPDLKYLLPFIGGKPRPRTMTPAMSRRFYLSYVALSRAQHLVCLAIQKQHVNQVDQDRLRNAGWEVQDLT
jgi:DNA helicase II / ATP-dependent DNA helicase PcrA